ncbi:MAG: hypothetical protein ACI383_06520, partial [Rummeliibacillus sp.]
PRGINLTLFLFTQLYGLNHSGFLLHNSGFLLHNSGFLLHNSNSLLHNSVPFAQLGLPFAQLKLPFVQLTFPFCPKKLSKLEITHQVAMMGYLFHFYIILGYYYI